MKKTSLGILLLMLIQSCTILSTPPAHAEKKSKEVAQIKAIGGIILTFFGTVHGAISGPFLIYDSRDKKDKIGGAAVSLVGLSIAYYGYKLAKDGLNDLHEIAQYPLQDSK